jgi:uncharacterized membrane protein
MGAVAVHVVDFNNNTQITARVAPRMLDLIVALAAGTAGAVATSRDDIADSLPGVAISIALVPPLCVVGISLAGGEWADAWGAFLLFITNFLSILMAGGAIFALFGLGAAAAASKSHFNKGRAYRVIAISIFLVAIPLSMTTLRVYRDSIAQVQVKQIADDWVGQYPTDFVVRSVLVSEGTAKVIVTASEPPPTIEDLATRLQSEVEQFEKLDLRFIPSRAYRYP